MNKSKLLLANVLIFATGCLGQFFFVPADAIMVTTSNLQDRQDPLDEKDKSLGALRHDFYELSYFRAILDLAAHTGSPSLLTILVATDLKGLIDVGNSSRLDGEALVDVNFGDGRIPHQPETMKSRHPDTGDLVKTTKTLTTSSWKMSALPLVGATVAFSGGVWLKRKRADNSGVAVKTPAAK